MSSIIEGYNYDIFISYRQKNEGERGRLGDEGTKRQDSVTFYVEKQIKELEFFYFFPFSLLDACFTDKSRFCQGRSVASSL